MYGYYIKVYRPNKTWTPNDWIVWRMAQLEADVQTQLLFTRCRLG